MSSKKHTSIRGKKSREVLTLNNLITNFIF